jgi:hypothetical protein
MNIELYPRNAYFIVIEAIKSNLGKYYNDTWGDLNMVHMRVYNKVTVPYEYNLRLVLSSYENGAPIHSSDWFKFSNDVTGQVGNDWLGDIIFTFPEYPMTNQLDYFLSMETQFYNPDSVETYLAVWCDWMQPVGIENTAGARAAIGVKR